MMLKVFMVVVVVTFIAVLPGLFLILVVLESERDDSLSRRSASNVLRQNGLHSQTQIDCVLRLLAIEHLESGSDVALKEFNKIASAARCCGFQVKGTMD